MIVGGGGAGASIGAGVGSTGSAWPISGAWLGGGGVAIDCGAAAVSAISSTSSTSIDGGSGGVSTRARLIDSATTSATWNASAAPVPASSARLMLTARHRPTETKRDAVEAGAVELAHARA